MQHRSDAGTGRALLRRGGWESANADGLREESGADVAEELLNEAATVEQFATLEAFVLVASRPST
jgi:hypothetical protein